MQRLVIFIATCLALCLATAYIAHRALDPEVASKVKILWANRLSKDQKTYGLALAALQDAIKLDPKSDTAFAMMGEIHADSEDLTSAVHDYDMAIKLNPRIAEYWFNRGNAYYANQKYDLAISDFGKAIEIEPKFARAYNMRGLAFGQENELDKEKSDYTKAIELAPSESIYVFNRSFIDYEQGDLEHAMEDVNQAIRISEFDSRYFILRGDIWIQKESYDSAIADYTKAISLDPNDAGAYLSRFRAYQSQRAYDLALTDVKRLLEIKPKSAQAYDLLAQVEMDKGETKLALADYAKAIELDSKPQSYRLDRAIAFLVQGENDHAIEAVTTGAGVDPEEEAKTWAVGGIRFAAGDFSGAAMDLVKTDDAERTHDGATALLLYFARQRAGSIVTATESLEALASRLTSDATYMPLVEFFLGKLSLAEARSKLNSKDICFANALVGEWRIVTGEFAEATATLKQVLDSCPKYRYSYALAKSELGRLRP